MLKVTGVEMELLTDPDMYLFFEEGIRGGVSSAMKRYWKANNVYMKDYDPEKPDVFIEYLDKNSLYATMLCKPLPVRKFKWLTSEEIGEMMEDHTKIRSCTLKVDLEYPKELHDTRNDYPLAPESVTVNGVKKLIPNLHDEETYVVHHGALRCYLRNGMVLRKIHEGILYEEQDFMKKYIEINAEARKIARNDFEKDFYKLMSNSVFGKTMEKVRNGLSEGVRLGRLVSQPYFRDAFVFEGSRLVSLRMGDCTVTLKKPIPVGQCVLDNAKGDMSEWHNGYMKPKYGERASLCYTDTDSFAYEIQTENFTRTFARTFRDCSTRRHIPKIIRPDYRG